MTAVLWTAACLTAIAGTGWILFLRQRTEWAELNDRHIRLARVAKEIQDKYDSLRVETVEVIETVEHAKSYGPAVEQLFHEYNHANAKLKEAIRERDENKEIGRDFFDERDQARKERDEFVKDVAEDITKLAAKYGYVALDECGKPVTDSFVLKTEDDDP